MPVIARPPRGSIKRVRSGKHFQYIKTDTNQKITSPSEIKRINSLRIAPGYHDVVISPSATSKVQAWGYDSKNRKQLTYNKSFIESQKAQKFADLANFNETYKRINNDVDLALKGQVKDPKGYIVRLIVKLCVLCHLRIGNDKYAKENQSYGLTTLLNKHVTIKDGKAIFDFIGKKAVRNVATCDSPVAIKILAALKSGKKPNDRLFSFTDEDNRYRVIDSSAVNDYLKSFDPNITSKDIRTYESNRLYTQYFKESAHNLKPQSEKDWKVVMRDTLKKVADRLHHTPAVCSRSYIHPDLILGLETSPAFRQKLLTSKTI